MVVFVFSRIGVVAVALMLLVLLALVMVQYHTVVDAVTIPVACYTHR